ncbi:hypothetical protein F3J23_17120 [Chryseobacterium sp. Tr-659]|uniref:hypothetical protein n=1 Tax=Chryseobacterium sp. Tr-659 TaxID=2608340 RepID=UPI0014231F74|nr:hypothetical protein [Chryseobacterium sp. Tr-659]NIF07147.1 hypothetical protein [Chryseobacterium sp. Tr-659]
MKLINTIEISPLQYSKEDFELPEISDYPDPDDWFTKWEEAVSKLNFNFTTIEKGSCLVDIETIDDDNLQMILEVKLEDMDWNDPEVSDYVLAFDGGIALKINDKIPVHPNCCTDLSDIVNWRNIFTNPSSKWMQIWIGHPWVYSKRENGKVSFSEHTESEIEDFENIKIILEVDEAELRTELEKMMEQQINFKNRITAILKKKKIKNAEEISSLLAGVSGLRI